MNKEIIKQLNNAKGKRIIEKIYLEYSKEIILELEKNPNILPLLLHEIEVTEEDFFQYISGETKANITFYDQTLTEVNKKSKELSTEPLKKHFER